MEFIQIPVTLREERGSQAMRRIRGQGRVPAVLYGLRKNNLSLTLPVSELQRFLKSGSHLVELSLGNETRDAILRDLQHDPVSDEILHVDFQRVDKDTAVEDHVPVHYKGEAPGTKEGGVFQAVLDQVTVRARPRDLPREILLDISELHVGDAIHVRDVALPEGVAFVNGGEELLCNVVTLRGQEAGEEGAEGEGAGEAEAAAEATAD